jgi:hypothetical protein
VVAKAIAPAGASVKSPLLRMPILKKPTLSVEDVNLLFKI